MENLKTNVENGKTTAENLAEHVGEYVETYIKLAVVNATEKATVVATVSLTAALLSFFCMFVLLFSGIGIALWVDESMQNIKAGYFCMAGVYLLGALLFVLLRKRLIFPLVRDHIIRKVYE